MCDSEGHIFGFSLFDIRLTSLDPGMIIVNVCRTLRNENNSFKIGGRAYCTGYDLQLFMEFHNQFHVLVTCCAVRQRGECNEYISVN